MCNIEEKVKKNLEKHFKGISDRIIELIIKSNKRYFAYKVKSDSELCNHEGWAYQIDYKGFDDENCVGLFEYVGYTVIDTMLLLV
ncbi:MAG: hypothetical protein ACLTDM_13225 [Clostridium butyricum]